MPTILHPETVARRLACALLMILASTTPGLAQTPSEREAGTFLGRSLALGAVLSSDEALAWGSFELDEEATDGAAAHGELERQQVAFRQRAGDRPSKPFWGLFAARGEETRHLDLGGVSPTDHESGFGFDVVSLGVETGARFALGDPGRAEAGGADGWFWSPRAALTFSHADQDLRYGADVVDRGPALDGRIFNWSAEALSVFGSATVGHRWRARGTVEIAAEVILIHTSVVSGDELSPDEDLSTAHTRFRFDGRWPTGGEIFGAALEVGLRLRHTFLDDDLATGGALGYGADRHTDVDLRWLARPEADTFPVGALGLSLRYVDTDGLDGWSVGLAVSP